MLWTRVFKFASWSCGSRSQGVENSNKQAPWAISCTTNELWFCVRNFTLRFSWYVCLVLNKWLTPWSTVLIEKLLVLQVVKKSPAFYGTLSFITVFTTAINLSQIWARSIQSTCSLLFLEHSFYYYPPIYSYNFLSFIFSSGFPTKFLSAPVVVTMPSKWSTKLLLSFMTRKVFSKMCKSVIISFCSLRNS